MRFAHVDKGVVNPAYTLHIVESHGVFLNADGVFFDGAVHILVERQSVFFGTVIEHRQCLCVVVLHTLAKRFFTFFYALVAVPPHIVMTVHVVPGSSVPLVFLCGT